MNAIAPGYLASSILLRGDARTAYRDPCAVYHEGVFHLFYTYVNYKGGRPFLHLAKSRSTDLRRWTAPTLLTPSDARLNYSSPGSIVRREGKWILSLQTYPRPLGEKYANETARLWTMQSDDLERWEEPRLLRVKGPAVRESDMGRMIDPFIFPDRQDSGKWWCFFKQNGVSMSWSRDLERWNYTGDIDAGENACVIPDGDSYLLFHSPENGIGVKRSQDLVHWVDEGLLTLGQEEWPWAAGRLTAGFVLDLRDNPAIGKSLMFFHGSGPENEDTMFDSHASIGLAWSDSLSDWQWV